MFCCSVGLQHAVYCEQFLQGTGLAVVSTVELVESLQPIVVIGVYIHLITELQYRNCGNTTVVLHTEMRYASQTGGGELPVISLNQVLSTQDSIIY